MSLLDSAVRLGHRSSYLHLPLKVKEKSSDMLSFFLQQVMLHQSGVLFDPLFSNISSSVVSKRKPNTTVHFQYFGNDTVQLVQLISVGAH